MGLECEACTTSCESKQESVVEKVEPQQPLIVCNFVIENRTYMFRDEPYQIDSFLKHNVYISMDVSDSPIVKTWLVSNAIHVGESLVVM